MQFFILVRSLTVEIQRGRDCVEINVFNDLSVFENENRSNLVYNTYFCVESCKTVLALQCDGQRLFCC